MLGFIGEAFTHPDQITGIVISIRKKKDTISIWNRSGSDMEIRNTIRQDLVRILGVPEGTKMDYQQFNESESKE